ncbi:MAG TPA: NAD(P)-dependent oxidoreductase, partial [Chloroflexota bacterium]
MSHRALKVVTSGPLPHVFPEESYRGQAEFQAAHTDDELRGAVRDADVLYSWLVPNSVPSETPRLRWIHLPSAGVDHLKGHPVWKSDILLSASTGIHTVPMSEHLFAMLLALTRQIDALVRAQERTEWLHDRRGSAARFVELRGKTMGIVGWGKIGDGAAHLARAFGMRVIGTRLSVVVPREVPRPTGAAYEDMPRLEPPDLPHDIIYPAAQLHDVLA